MKSYLESRRRFLKVSGLSAGALLLAPTIEATSLNPGTHQAAAAADASPADYTIRIGITPVEVAPNRIISTVTYNGQFPGPLLRFKEGKRVTVDIYNDTEVPEQLHWHGQIVSTDVDGAAEEGTPYVQARGKRRIMFEPRPAGLRFYHTHNRAGADLYAVSTVGRSGQSTLSRLPSPAAMTVKSF